MPTSDFRQQVVVALREAVQAHEVGRFQDIGEAYDRLAAIASQQGNVDADLRIALDFLDGWYDSSNHGWQYYDPLGAHDWPRLSVGLAMALESGEPIDEDLRRQFTLEPRRGVWARIRASFKGSA